MGVKRTVILSVSLIFAWFIFIQLGEMELLEICCTLANKKEKECVVVQEQSTE